MKRENPALKTAMPTAAAPEEKPDLAFTGERYVPTEQGEIRLEHFHRYAVAMELVAGKDVLDLASGEGYGSFHLAELARSVTGIDISSEAVQHAKIRYRGRANLQFKQGSATRIECPDHAFDVVVSFETIEHLAEQSQMLAEIRRVLKPDGILLISSPNRPVYSEASNHHNEFHVKELDFAEFDSLLREQFGNIRYLGQRLQIGSFIQAMEGEDRAFEALLDDGAAVHNKTGQLHDPVYFLALCSASNIQLPAIDASIMQPENLDLLKQYIGYATWANNTNAEIKRIGKLHADLNAEHHKIGAWAQALDRQVADLNQLISARDGQIAALSKEIASHGAIASGLEAQLETSRKELESSRAEISRAILEREEQIQRLNQLIGELQKKISELDQELLQAQHDLQLREQLHANNIQRALLDFEREKLAASESHAARERALFERLLQAQVEIQRVEQQSHLVSAERVRLQESTVVLEEKIAALNEQQITDQIRHAQALTQAQSEREQKLIESHLAAQVEFHRLDKEWVKKSAEQQHELILSQNKSAELQSQLQAQISAAKQLTNQLDAATTVIKAEIEAIQSGMAWRLFAPLRKLGKKGRSIIPGYARHERLQRSVASTQILSMSTQAPESNQEKSNKYLEEVSMSNHLAAPLKYPNTSAASLDELLSHDDEAFVRVAYLTLLQRQPDAEGLTYYVQRLRRGFSKLQVLGQIWGSDEAQGRAIRLPGLEERLRQSRWLRIPLIGAYFRIKETNQKLHVLENQLSRINHSAESRFDQIEKAIAALQHSVSYQTQTAAVASIIQRLDQTRINSWQAAEKILSDEGSTFLQNLFLIALGRSPEKHEESHYLHLLENGSSKLPIIELIFSSEECQARVKPSHAPSNTPEGQPFSPPATIEMPDLSASISAESIRFTLPEKPLVSVIIPVYGKVDYTLMCLKSIQKHAPEVAFEIIVVDDKSPDNTVKELVKIRGIRLVENAENCGFIRSCNHGASHAKGQYLCFLNNDTEVTAGWLDELVRTFHELPGTGLAGSKLVYPDRTLQEAGGILWRDGSAWNFGRNQDPSLPVYNYAREVDYCSGASIMVPKSLFSELGGFDEHYAPAYCEDSDLALKIRNRGLRVIYQPLSTVIHYEGVTSGTDTSQGTKSYQVENSKKLYSRWKERLAHHQDNGKDVDSAKDRMAKRRVLVLEHCTPTPDQDAGSVSVVNILILLRELGFQITFIPEDNFLYMPDYTVDLQRIGVEMLYAPYVKSVEEHLKESGSRYDLVFLFRPLVVERNFAAISKYCKNAKTLFYTHDIHHIRMFREATLLKDAQKRRAAEEMKKREFKSLKSVDAAIIVSTAELEMLKPELPDANLKLLPLILDIPGTDKNFEDRNGIVFVGGYQHGPNVDAVRHFVTDVMPFLRKLLPGVRFYAVGSNPPPEILALANKDVVVAGYVENLPELLDQMRVAVAPLRFGAGIKGKIGTAMSVGLPSVATTLAVEGMGLSNDENILVADDAELFAKAVARVYNDKSCWTKISANGLKFARQAWGPEAAMSTMESILQELNIKTEKNRYPYALYSSDKNVYAPAEHVVEPDHAHTLRPLGIARSMQEFEKIQSAPELADIRNTENIALDANPVEEFTVEGFCVPCGQVVPLLVDMESGGQLQGSRRIPNWRERLECPSCRMNNRQRLIGSIVQQFLDEKKNERSKVYFMEAVTPMFQWAQSALSEHDIIGSEYLGYEYESGALVNGIRHEDVMNLSFNDASLDMIVSNDVFEHIPEPETAFKECVRALKKGGVMIATFPFYRDREDSTVRAKLTNDGINYLHERLYHGNPVSTEGSLVFTDFGWDTLDLMKSAGFQDVCVEVYGSVEFGHLGDAQLVFRATK